MNRYLGIDIGGTTIKYGLYDEDGNSIKNIENKIKTPKYSLSKFLDTLMNIINEFEELDGIGMSIPGCINPDNGYIQNGGSIRCLDNVNIINEMSRLTDIKVEIENDANCALLAEKWIGNAIDSSNFICMTVGTGIGGAIYINNQLIRGHNFFSGEFGYMIIEDIYEKFKIHTLNKDSATVPFTKNIAREKGLDIKNISGNEIFELIEAGDLYVIEYYKRWIRRLAICIYNLGFILDPQKILIGGGVSSESRFISDLKWEIESISIELIPELGKLESLHSRWEICACKHYNDSGKIGAVYNFISRNRENKLAENKI